MDEDYSDEDPMPRNRRTALQPNPLFYILIGLVIGFTISTLISPDFLEGLSNPQKFDGNVTNVEKYVSNDLRANLVILRINDSNSATCIDGEACLAYQPGDTVHVTCIGIQCTATKKS